MVSSKDPAKLTPNAVALARDVDFTTEGMPSRCLGNQQYNATELGTNAPVKGQVTFQGEDGLEYIVIACNNLLYWSNGDGVFTIVKYLNDNTNIAIDTANHWFNFQLFDKVISSVQKKVVYVISDVYPLATNSNGTHAAHSTTSRALRLQLNSGVVIGLNIYEMVNAGDTAGTDDVAVGRVDDTNNPIGWPKNGRYATKIFDKILIANYLSATNGWTTCNAQDSETWTNPDTLAGDAGGGKNPEPFTMCFAVDTFVLLFTRHGIMNLSCTPGDVSTWRESWIKTDLGNVGQQVALHSDGWVYFISEQGTARTNGYVAERVDFDIEDQIQPLSQLVFNRRSLIKASATDWNAGIMGTNQLDSSDGTLRQKPIDTDAEWALGTLSNVSTTANANHLQLEGGYNGIADLAAGKTVTSDLSFVGINVGSRAVDSNDTTPAQIAVAGWIKVDLGASYSIGSIRGLFNVNGTAILANEIVTFEWSLDNSAWTAVAAYTPIYGNNDKTATFTPIMARYVRIKLAIGAGGGNAPLYVFSLNVYARYQPTGNWISPVVDYGKTPDGTFQIGILSSKFSTLLSGQSINYYISDSADNITYSSYSLIGTANTVGQTKFSASIPTNTKRYAKYKAVLATSSPYQNTPDIQSIVWGGQWRSATTDLGSTPTGWGPFVADDVPNNETLEYWMEVSTDGASWDSPIPIANNAIPKNINSPYAQVALKRYVRISVNLYTDDIDKIPYLNGLTVNYYTSSQFSSQPTIYSYRQKLYLCLTPNGSSTNTLCFVGESKPIPGLDWQASPITGVAYPIWSKRTTINANCFSVFRSQLVSGNSNLGRVWIEECNTTGVLGAIQSVITTAAVHLTERDILVRLAYLFYQAGLAFTIEARSRVGAGDWGAWVSGYTAVPGASISGLPQSPNLTRSYKINFTQFPDTVVDGSYVQFRITSSSSDDPAFMVQGMDVYVDPRTEGRS